MLFGETFGPYTKKAGYGVSHGDVRVTNVHVARKSCMCVECNYNTGDLWIPVNGLARFHPVMGPQAV